MGLTHICALAFRLRDYERVSERRREHVGCCWSWKWVVKETMWPPVTQEDMDKRYYYCLAVTVTQHTDTGTPSEICVWDRVRCTWYGSCCFFLTTRRTIISQNITTHFARLNPCVLHFHLYICAKTMQIPFRFGCP